MWALKPKGFIESIGSWGRIYIHGLKGLSYLGFVALIGVWAEDLQIYSVLGIVGLRLTCVCSKLLGIAGFHGLGFRFPSPHQPN